MKAIVLLYDSLVKNLLSAYGCDWTETANFRRLADRSLKFDRHYAGSLPCMPARRELHTGRYNFLTRSWGPLEPFDTSLIEKLKGQGIHTHLASDHYHYWEDGGANYHCRFSTWEIVRGQEGDKWKGQLEDPAIPEPALKRPTHRWRQDWVNRGFIREEADFPLTLTMDLGLEFVDRNKGQDNWFLQIECFDPHEPFFAPDRYKQLYPHDYDGPFFDWPPYRPVNETDPAGAVEHIRKEYAALLSMCDHNLGRLLDKLDENDLWDDTMLIVTTDHGFMLGEHGWLGKNVGPTYNEIASIPLFVWDPRIGRSGESVSALTQTIDIVPTLYSYFGLEIPESVQGHDLLPVIKEDRPVRDYAIYGIHGGYLNYFDGRYVFMCAPDEAYPSYNYTLMCAHMMTFFSKEEIDSAELVGPTPFSDGYKLLKVKKIKPKNQSAQKISGSMIFDLHKDPDMNVPIEDPELEKELRTKLAEIIAAQAAPEEIFKRYHLQ